MTHPLTNALAMRTAAAEALASYEGFSSLGRRTGRDIILALPLEADRAALLAEAVRMPEIAGLITDMEEILRISDRNQPTWNRAWAIIRELKPFLALETP